MRRSDFNLKRNTNTNKTEKKERAKINKFEQSIYQNTVINFFIIVLTLFSSTPAFAKTFVIYFLDNILEFLDFS